VSKDLSKRENSLFHEVSNMIEFMEPLIERNLLLLTNQVDVIIKSPERDEDIIQRLLDSVLDYAGMYNEGLVLFKRLCRYYYAINPQVTVEYISIYRDLYDSVEEGAYQVWVQVLSSALIFWR